MFGWEHYQAAEAELAYMEEARRRLAEANELTPTSSVVATRSMLYSSIEIAEKIGSLHAALATASAANTGPDEDQPGYGFPMQWKEVLRARGLLTWVQVRRLRQQAVKAELEAYRRVESMSPEAVLNWAGDGTARAWKAWKKEHGGEPEWRTAGSIRGGVVQEKEHGEGPED
jgi:hypothetical protein